MTGQWLTPADGIRWFYDSGALSLDFAHTGELDATAGTEQLPRGCGMHVLRFQTTLDDAELVEPRWLAHCEICRRVRRRHTPEAQLTQALIEPRGHSPSVVLVAIVVSDRRGQVLPHR